MSKSSSNVADIHQQNAGSEDSIIVACDDGFAAIKLAFRGEGGEIKQFSIPSRACLGTGRAMSASGAKTSGTYFVDDDTYTVSDHLDPLDTRFQSYPVSDLNRVLVNHALRAAGLGDRRIRLGTGLPPGRFFSAEGLNTKIIEGKRASLLKPVVAGDGNSLAHVVQHEIFSEAATGLIDYIVSDDFIHQKDISNPIIIVDIGGRTTDIVTVLPPGDAIDQEQTGTLNTGVLKVQDILRQRIIDNFDDVEQISSRAVERAMQTHRLMLYGREHDVSSLANDAIREVGIELLQYVHSKLSNLAEVERVIFIGGGASVMRHVIDQFPQAFIPESPEYANARGMLKYMHFSKGA